MNTPMIPLGDVVEVKGGGTPSKANPAFWNGDIPWVSPKDMKRWEIDDAEDKITSEAIKGSATNLVPENSILVVNRSGILKHTLPVGITRRPVAINQDLKALICGPRSHPAYIARIVKAAEPIVLKWVRATTADNFSIENLRSLEIPLPPLDEQRRIAAILDKADALRRKRKRALDLLDSLTQSIFLEMFGDPLSNPKKWPHAELGDLIHRASDGPHVSPEYSVSGIPFLSTRHIQKGMVLWEDLKFIDRAQAEIHWKKCRPERGDILYTKGGTTGLAAVVETDEPFAVWVHVALLKTDRKKVEPLWLESMLNSEYCYRQSQRYTHGIANHDLGLKRMIKIEMYLPSKLEQQRFVSAVTCLGQIRKNATRAARDDDFLFSSLQHRAFSSQL